MSCEFCYNGEWILLTETGKKRTFQCNNCKNYKKEIKGELTNNPNISDGVKETSKRAKEQIDSSGEAGSQRELVLRTIKKSNGLSIHQVSDLTGLQKSSVSPRMNELKKENLIYLSGKIVYKGKENEVYKAN